MIRSVNELLVPIGAIFISIIGMCILIIFRINNAYLFMMVGFMFPIFSTIVHLLISHKKERSKKYRH